jgi:hypothetical protein
MFRARLGNPILISSFSFLGYIDMVGTSFTENHIATGYGAHIAIPLLRKSWRPDLTRDEAKKLLDDCMRVLFYRDARALNKVSSSRHSEETQELTCLFVDHACDCNCCWFGDLGALLFGHLLESRNWA